MKIVFIILLLAFLGWKGYHAWRRGRNSYLNDCERYQSLREYLLGNGATEYEARRPFLLRAIDRALRPMLKQWQFWTITAVLLLLCLIV
jgi:hypothetical protein